MNERLKELMLEAGYAAPELAGRGIKLAELIVRDCAESALAKGRASPDTDFRTGSYVISEYLLSRYGVE
jgi:hypothetical protein